MAVARGVPTPDRLVRTRATGSQSTRVTLCMGDMETMRLVRAFFLVGLTTMLTGCATILSGTTQNLTVNSNVSGADVYLNQTLLGKTPFTASIKRGQSGLLRITAPGYQPYQISLDKKVAGMFWVNILSGGPYGSSTDYSTGAMYAYEPSTYMVSLQRQTGSAEDLRQWQRTEGLRAFVLQNNEALVADLALGRGEYVDVLMTTFKVAAEDRTKTIERWRSDYTASRTALEFADRLVASINQ